MGLLYRKRFRLSKWLSLNVSKSGLGLSVGPPGAKLSINPKRARMQIGIPGTGISYRREVSMPRGPDTLPQSHGSSPSRHHWGLWLVATVGLLLLAVWLGGCGFPAWRDRALRDVAEGRWHVIPEQVPAGGAPSQTTEFYDAAGRHLGYGTSSGGSVNVYGPDGSRVGSGRR